MQFNLVGLQQPWNSLATNISKIYLLYSKVQKQTLDRNGAQRLAVEVS